jgi:hypothetical protein
MRERTLAIVDAAGTMTTTAWSAAARNASSSSEEAASGPRGFSPLYMDIARCCLCSEQQPFGLLGAGRFRRASYQPVAFSSQKSRYISSVREVPNAKPLS